MKIFLYDGSFEGLLTCIYYSFYSKTPPLSIYSEKNPNIPLLFDEVIKISTEHDKYKKVRAGILNKIDTLCLKKVYLLYLSNYENKEMILFKYLTFAFKIGKDTHAFLHIDVIRLVDVINRRVTLESHRFKGFIRFNYIEDRFLYSSIEPDNDILELLGDHFKKRFCKEYFIIHDISREKALIYNTISYEIISMSIDDYEKLKLHNDEYSHLWNAYFKATTIKERTNLKLQSRMMPKRYWKHILEISNIN